MEQVRIEGHYAGYLARQEADIAAYRRDEALVLPADLDYRQIGGLSTEIRDLLARHQPRSLGQAARISGVTPAALMALLRHVKAGKAAAGQADGGTGCGVSAPLTAAEIVARLNVSRETGARLEAYVDLLATWQKRINLVGPSTLADPWRRHILDSAQLVPHIGAGKRSSILAAARVSRAWCWPF